MKVASQHCDTVQNKRKDILDIFIFSLGQLRSIERFRTVETVAVETVKTVETVEAVEAVEINRKDTKI